MALVAGGDELLETQIVEVQDEVIEEITHPRIVAVAEDCLTLEVLPIVLELSLYVYKLRIELIFLGFLSPSELLVCHKRIA